MLTGRPTWRRRRPARRAAGARAVATTGDCGDSGALLIDDPDDPVLGGGLWLCIEGAGAACKGVGVGAGAVTPPTWVCSRS